MIAVAILFALTAVLVAADMRRESWNPWAEFDEKG